MTRGVTLGLVVLSLLSGARAVAQPATQAASGRILVMPFENATHESRIIWLGEAAAVLLADDLNAFGVNAITREERRQAFDVLQVPPSSSLTDATVIRIGQIVAASQVVIGTVELEGDQLVVRARGIALEAGRLQSNVTERGDMADLFAIFERVARRVMSPSAAGAGGAPPAHPPVAAFENYIKGLLAETPGTAVNYLTAALRADPKFDRARLALWDVFDEEGEHERALAAVRPVPSGSDSARHAHFLAALSELNLHRHEEAFASFKALADSRPTAPVLNNLGVIQLRRGGSQQLGVPTYYFNKAVEADPTEPDYFFNLGYAYWLARDIPAAIYWLRETLRRDPANGDAHYVLGVALTTAGNATEASREKELARRLSSLYADWEKRPGAEVVPKGLERVKRDVELPHARTIGEALAIGGQRDQEELAGFYLDRARRLYEQENDREALNELSRALFLSPYQAQAHLLVARIHLRSGRVRDAIDALNISLWSAETAEAHAWLAEAHLEARNLDLARSEAERALALDPQSTVARRVLDRLPPK
jgi:tetratricopeptide (TPR) repeat protein/TolB-like protein